MSESTTSDPEMIPPTPFQKETYGGHPTSLFLLFFAEMWERFSYYGMRALLVLYIIKGFLGRSDTEAYAIYGAYTALVYATPFIGGMIADRLIGARRAVILGGLLMALGHLIMTIEHETPFYYALSFLIVGNGFFKPNISTIVGSLYPPNSPQRDAGFTVFYIGINLGAAMAPLLCGYVGETYGWHYGFGLATIGMLVGLAVFVAPAALSRLMILVTAFVCGGAMIYLNYDEVIYTLGPNAVVALCLMVSGVFGFLALGQAGLPTWAGAPPNEERLNEVALPSLKEHLNEYFLVLIGITLLAQHLIPAQGQEALILLVIGLYAYAFPWLKASHAVYLGAFISTPLISLLVQRNEVAGATLTLLGVAALGYLVAEMMRSTKVERERLQVVMVLMFFSMLFWAFFEQAGSSINMFTDRNVDRVFSSSTITPDQVGTQVDVEVSQGLTGYSQGGNVITMIDIDRYRARKISKIKWQVSESDVGMPTAGSEVATSQFQAANPIFIIFFGLLFSALWGFLGRRKIEPTTPVKFGLGILQLGMGFGVLWWGATNVDLRGMVGMSYLLLAYLLITTGELCLSPVGLSMVTKLAPKRIVSMVMGAWFLATAFSNYLSALIAMFTGIKHDSGETSSLPPPTETAEVYANVFGPIAVAAIVSAVIMFALSPLLSRWMHEGVIDDET
jgi:proton-dependent oligopeptide transporter, POT family